MMTRDEFRSIPRANQVPLMVCDDNNPGDPKFEIVDRPSGIDYDGEMMAAETLEEALALAGNPRYEFRGGIDSNGEVYACFWKLR